MPSRSRSPGLQDNTFTSVDTIRGYTTLRMRSMICFPGSWRRVPATTVSSRRQSPGPRSRRSAALPPHHVPEGNVMATADNTQLIQHIFAEAAQGNLEPFLEGMAE